MQCLKCEKVLVPVFSESPYQPKDGLIFESTGNYGSTVFDPCTPNPPNLTIHICDDCISNAASRKIVYLIERSKQIKENITLWDPEIDIL